MKHKDNPKTTSLSKLTLKMAAGAIVGTILGASAAVLLSLNNGNSFNQAAQKLISGIQNMIFPGLLLITVLSIILQEIYYSRLKNICNSLADADDEEFDELDYKEEKTGAVLMTSNLLSYIGSIVLLAFGYSMDYLHHSIALGACLTFLICVFYDGIMQARYIKLLQKTHPEKKGDVSSMKFQQQWLESCDRAEKESFTRARNKAFSLTSKCLSFLLLLTMLSHLFFHTGVLTILVVGITQIILSLTYNRSCVKLKEVKLER